MGADLFESYVGALISALTLGVVYFQVSGALFPLLISGLGLISSILGTFFVKGDEKLQPTQSTEDGILCIQYSGIDRCVFCKQILLWQF